MPESKVFVDRKTKMKMFSRVISTDVYKKTDESCFVNTPLKTLL